MAAESWAVLDVLQSVCLSICVREPGVWEASAPLWVCTLGLGRVVVGDDRGEQVGGDLPGGVRWLPRWRGWPNLSHQPGVGAWGVLSLDLAQGGGPRCRALSLPQPSSILPPAH